MAVVGAKGAGTFSGPGIDAPNKKPTLECTEVSCEKIIVELNHWHNSFLTISIMDT